jgi:hypothetical protein
LEFEDAKNECGSALLLHGEFLNMKSYTSFSALNMKTVVLFSWYTEQKSDGTLDMKTMAWYS